MNGSEQLIAIIVGIMFLGGVTLFIYCMRQRSNLRMRWMK